VGSMLNKSRLWSP